MADGIERYEEIIERLARLEERVGKSADESAESIQKTVSNEARLKSIQHRVDEAEGREEAAARDIHEMRMILLEQETRLKATVSLLKVFGSIVTCLSVLIQIGRAILF